MPDAKATCLQTATYPATYLQHATNIQHIPHQTAGRYHHSTHTSYQTVGKKTAIQHPSMNYTINNNKHINHNINTNNNNNNTNSAPTLNTHH
jgi:hypothetical protein